MIAEARDLDERLALLLPVLVAWPTRIAYAHSQRVIHRDLKPANVLVGAFGETVVIDWGLAKDVDEPDDRATSGVVAATIRDHDDSDGRRRRHAGVHAARAGAGRARRRRADVYALGAMLYHLLAGRSPYADATER